VLQESSLLPYGPHVPSDRARRRSSAHAIDALVRPAIVRELTSARVAAQQHVWLNLSTWRVQALLAAGPSYANPRFYMHDCRRVASHVEWIAACLDRLVTTPVRGSRLATEHAALRARLPADGAYVGIHVRTMASDFKALRPWRRALRNVTLDTRATLRLLAWDMGVNVSSYVAAVRVLCRRGQPLYVASDSRAVTRAFAEQCPPGSVLTANQPPQQRSRVRWAWAWAPTAEAKGPATASDPLDAPLLDWLALAEATESGRWAHDSSFLATSVQRGRFCAGRMAGLMPKPWARRRRIHSWTLWNNLRRAALCYDDASTCDRGKRSNRVRAAIELHRSRFASTPCEGLETVLQCARYVTSGLISS